MRPLNVTRFKQDRSHSINFEGMLSRDLYYVFMKYISLDEYRQQKALGLTNRQISALSGCNVNYLSILNNINIDDFYVYCRDKKIPLSIFDGIKSYSQVSREFSMSRGDLRYIGKSLGCSVDRGDSVRLGKRNQVDPMSYEQKQIVLGGLLGDAWCTQYNAVRFSQSSIHLPYVNWLYTKLSPLCTYQPRKYYGKAKGKIYENYKFTLKVSDETRLLRNIFYPNGHKIVPFSAINEIDALGLAVWYMDDGGTNWFGKKHTPLARIYTLGFDCKEHEDLIVVLNNRFGIQSYKRKHKYGKKWFLCFDVENTKKLFDVITPHFCPEMFYKVIHEKAIKC